MPSKFFRAVAASAAFLAGTLGPAGMSVAQQVAPSVPFPDVPGMDAWVQLDAMPELVEAMDPWIRPHGGQRLLLNLEAMKFHLASAPLEDSGIGPIVIVLPRPDGSWDRFRVWESPIMEPALAAFMSDCRTFVGQGIDDRAASLRMDYTQHGFHAQVLSPRGCYWIDPYSRGDTAYYTSYRKADLANVHAPYWRCHTHAPAQDLVEFNFSAAGPDAPVNRRTFRTCVAATGEYTVFHGGTVSAGQAAIVTAINRVTGVYEVEVACRMTLIANNSSVVYTNGGTDPYSNNNGSAMLTENINNLNAVIGSANFDHGHVFSTGGGGVAFLGVQCTSNKAGGVTGLPSPTGDPFYIDYVAHEMGHQFGANHTFNGTGGSCSGNRAASAAYEPGSASTIMGYAGICGADNLQSFSDPYFSFISIAEMTARLNSIPSCGTTASAGNDTPTVSAGSAFSIPLNTPFTLTATGSDPNGDTVSFCWEQRDLGAALSLAAADNGASPILRSLLATTSPSRTLPRLSGVLNGTNATLGEKLPSVARANNFKWRVTARDNRAGGGGTAFSDVTLNAVAGTGPFQVTSPNTAVSWSGTQTVTWNVGGTTAAPISCANVKISLSTDGGNTFPTVLLASTPNDGSEAVTLPAVSTTTARIKVEAVGNIFFDISNANFTITAPAPPIPTNITANPANICSGGTSLLSAECPAGHVIDWFITFCGGSLVGTTNSAATIAVSPASSTTYFCRSRRLSDGAVSSCGFIQVVVSAAPIAPSSALVDRPSICIGNPGTITLSAVGGSGATLRWFAGSCGGPTVGTGTPLAIPGPTSTTTYYCRWENSCGGSECRSVTVTVSNRADLNEDGEIDFSDIELFIAYYNAGDPRADFNGDEEIDFSDIEAFIAVWSTGC